jgi:hypothetical protein
MAILVLLLLVIVAIAVGAVYLSWYAAKKRREAFATLARRQGWSWVAEDDSWCRAFTGSPFGVGHNRSATNVVTGTAETRRFVAFDYCYFTTQSSTDGQGHTSSHEVIHEFGVVAVDTGVPLPGLQVTPEGMLGRLLGRLTGRDIELESEEFNRAFTVTCPDRKFASDVLNPTLMEYLLGHRDTSFRFDTRWALCILDGEVPPESIELRLGYLDTVLDTIPEFVWAAAKGGPS